MSVISLIIVGTLFLGSFVMNQKKYNPTTIFCGLFFGVLFIASIDWFGLYESPDISYILITLGVLFFFVGSELTKKIYLKIGSYNEERKIKLNDKVFYVAIIVCLLILLPRIIAVLFYIVQGNSFGNIYVTVAASMGGEDGELAQSSMFSLLTQFIAYPILYSVVPISLVQFFNTYKFKYLLISTFLATIRVFLDSRRTYIFTFFIMLIFEIICHRREILSSEIISKIRARKIYRWALMLIVLLVLSFIVISNSRWSAQGVKGSIYSTVINYFGGCVQYFGKCIETYNYNPTYGFSSLRGFFAPIFGILGLIGIRAPQPYVEATEIVNNMKYIVIEVSEGKKYNSFTTCFYQFYCDGGVAGVIIMSFLYGVFAQSLYKRFTRYKDIRSEAKYIYFLGSILVLSFTNMLTILAYVAMPLIFDFIFYKKVGEE